ncbi:LytR/AlgR family response regulator transcription factor [Pedobacter jeongneungensis]|uniref:LytR/AlgR family response regulator transcription factor n=1 Tax=Pedobacter jeongneungensis TaxID=947309 RepID=UPI00046831E6|nr:LytTR family DNA-binding domain-containing protein [Pedobacter jeongneungensis]
MHPTLKCVIIDDEPFAIKLLSEQIDTLDYLTLYKTYTNPLTALAEIQEHEQIDILFVDIDMPQLSGIDLASKLSTKVSHIIFTTAYPQFALEAFGVHAADYLLKPIEPAKFIVCTNRILNLSVNKSQPQPLPNEKIFIKGETKGKFIAINPSEIIIIYVQEHYIMIETHAARYRTTETLKNIEERLSTDRRFIRIHQSNIINMEKIVHVDGNTVYMEQKWKAPISENYKKKFMALIANKLLSPK